MQLSPGVARVMQIELGDEIEFTLGDPLGQVANHELNIDLTGRGRRTRALNRHLAEVDRHNTPALAGEPYGVGSLTAGYVEGPARLESADHLHQQVVRLS